MFKKLIIIAILLLIFIIPAGADDTARAVVGAKIDAPDLIVITDNLSIGLEGGKNLANNVFQEDSHWVEDDKGYFGYVKITYWGSLLDFSK